MATTGADRRKLSTAFAFRSTLRPGALTCLFAETE
jgi:hypothetical protein